MSEKKLKKQYRDPIRYKLIQGLENEVKYAYKLSLKAMELALQKTIDKF